MSPEERLSKSVDCWLSASGSLIVPSERTNGDTVSKSDSLESFATSLNPLAGQLLTVDTAADFVEENDRFGGFWLVAVVFVFLPGVAWAVHGTVAASNSSESGVALDLDGGWGDLFALTWVGGLTSLHGRLEVQVAGFDRALGGFW